MSEDKFSPKHADMSRHLMSGILNSGFVQMVRVICQLGSVVFLSRLLPPSDFGIIAMVGPLYGFIMLFQDLGLGQATIQKQVLNHDEVNFFFWLNVLAGALLTVVTIGLSPVVGWYYNEPRLVSLTAAMGLLIFVSSLGNQPTAILTRRMEFRTVSLIGALGAISGLITSIIAALYLKNYWALYWGMAVGTLIPVIAAIWAADWKPTSPKRLEAARQMMKFGAGVTTANLSNFFSGNMDNILIGWRWGEHLLGLYDRAYKLLSFPIQRLVGPVMSTMIPVLSRLIDEPEKYRNVLLKTLRHLSFAAWPGILWAAIFSKSVVIMLLGTQWIESSDIFRPLALTGLVQVINYSTGSQYISQGRSTEFAKWSFVGAIIDVSSFVIGLPHGPKGVAIAYTVSEYARTPFLWWAVTRAGPLKGRDVIKSIIPQGLGIMISSIVLILFIQLTDFPALVSLAIGIVISYATTTLVMTFFATGRQTLEEIRVIVGTTIIKFKK